MKIYSGYKRLPNARASSQITEGCLVLEGGGWRGLYTQGALDALMEEGINFRRVIGVSAGALSAMGYLSGQIGICARINLKYRHDSDYCGIGAILNDKGVTGFTHFFRDIAKKEGFDWKRFLDPERSLAVSVTNLQTGEIEYMEKGSCNIRKAIKASATVPYVSAPVKINGIPYLDGGCTEKIPYHLAKKEGHERIIVIRTRDRSFRREEKNNHILSNILYMRYPAFREAMGNASKNYNLVAEELEADEAAGRTFMQAPKDPVNIKKFESDMEKLGDLYFRGYNEMKEKMPALWAYLGGDR